MTRIRPMTTGDLRLGLKLTHQAGWNQMEADWLRFIQLWPEGCFVAELNGNAVGTTATCVLGRVARIAMVLVDINCRGKGIGTALLKHSISYLKERNVETIRLDATPLGQPIYDKVGFLPEYELARFEFRRAKSSPPMGDGGASPTLPTMATADDFASIIDFDTQITGTDRGKMLRRLFEEFPENVCIVRHAGRIEGFITRRPGANATQVGPCRATAAAGPVLLCDALNKCAGKPVFVDVPLDNTGSVKIVEASGLTLQRRFTRMYWGRKPADDVKTLWASSGPEKG
jgi:GNAT superfamily N-acetyltransferase